MRSSAFRERSPRSRGFTLVELLVVVAIIGVLVALLLPAIQAAREAARRSQCANNLRQMALAMQNYHDSLKGFPAGAMVSNQLSWNCLILPFMEQAALHDRFVELGTFNRGTFNGGTNNEGANKANLLSLTKVETFLCPSALRDFATHGSARMSNPDRMGYASHYEGVAGPVGINPMTGRDYPHDPNPTGHGGFALSGVLHRDSGRYEISGSVTFQGNPVPSGSISFDPVNGGVGGGFAAITDGRYDTSAEGRGHLGGPHNVVITGHTGQQIDPGNPDSDFKPLFPPYETTVDLPSGRSSEDFTIP